jgi:hypothetical protein
MRTKTLLAAALLAAGVATSMAQSNVYSLNVVGYANVVLAAGNGIYANPFDKDGTNAADVVLNVTPTSNPGGPGLDAFYLLTWNGSSFDSVFYESDFPGTGWNADAGGDPLNVRPAPLLPPGKGFFLTTQLGAFTNVFVGNVVPAPGTTNTATMAAGNSMIGSRLPVAGSLTNYAAFSFPQNGFNSSDASADAYYLLQWNGSSYDSKFFESDFPAHGWATDASGSTLATPPILKIGEGFFLSTQLGAFPWSQSLSNAP